MSGTAVPRGLWGRPLVELLSWADCGIQQDEHGQQVAVDCLTGEMIEDPWAWLRSAHGRFGAWEKLVEAQARVVVEVANDDVGQRCSALLGALGYKVEVRRVG